MSGASDGAYQGLGREQVADGFVSGNNVPPFVLSEWALSSDPPWGAFLPSEIEAAQAFQAYRRYGVDCDVLVATECVDDSDAEFTREGEEFLGFDVCAVTLQDAILMDRASPRTYEEIPKDLGDYIHLWKLEEAFVRRTTNRFGLLASYEAARVVRDSNCAIRRLVNQHVKAYIVIDLRVFAVSRLHPDQLSGRGSQR